MVRSLHQRLLNVSSIPGYELILECYHPSAKISTPYLSCRYAGTRHPADCDNDQGGDDTSTRTTPHHQHRRPRDGDTGLSHVCRLYASFRPVVTEENRRRRFRMVWPVSVSGGPPAGFDSEDEVATQDLQLDDGELFSQLCTVLNLVTQGKAPGTFVTHYNMSEHVVRVFRRWLDEMSAAAKSDEAAWDPARKVPLASSRMLWVDAANTIGLRFHVSPGLAERMPLLSGPGEDPAVSYTLTYEGWSRLLLNGVFPPLTTILTFFACNFACRTFGPLDKSAAGCRGSQEQRDGTFAKLHHPLLRDSVKDFCKRARLYAFLTKHLLFLFLAAGWSRTGSKGCNLVPWLQLPSSSRYMNHSGGRHANNTCISCVAAKEQTEVPVSLVMARSDLSSVACESGFLPMLNQHRPMSGAVCLGVVCPGEGLEVRKSNYTVVWGVVSFSLWSLAGRAMQCRSIDSSPSRVACIRKKLTDDQPRYSA